MTPEAINIAIAKHLGAKPVLNTRTNEVFLTFEPQNFSHPDYWTHLDVTPEEDVYLELGVPNYAGNLNAMHSLEGCLPWHQLRPYTDELANRFTDGFVGVRYTAIQRAEAYLRTVGKWKEAA